MSVSVGLIKALNKLFPKVVHPFNLENKGEKTYAEWQYEKGANTIAVYADRYKPYQLFEGKTVLDIGCGAAGKSLYYASQGAERVVGVDIVPHYEKEAMGLARKLGLEDRFLFVCASADSLPWLDCCFDTIIMNDAMEHVSNPEGVLKEALRLLRPDGKLFINFPPYGHPFGAHMSDAIGIPWVHYLFPERALIAAYKDLVRDLPDGQERIDLRITTDRQGRESIGYINRMTIKRFRRILRENDLKPVFYKEIPLRPFLTPLAKLPGTKELFVKMVVCVLPKPGVQPEGTDAEVRA